MSLTSLVLWTLLGSAGQQLNAQYNVKAAHTTTNIQKIIKQVG
jgi:hypothetical protein